MTFKDPVKLMWLILLGLTFSVALAGGIWCFIILHKDWNKIYIVKRRRIFVTALLICCCILVYGFTTVTSLTAYFPSRFSSIFYLRMYEIIFLPTTILIGWMVTCRFWIFYYDSKIMEFETNKEWRMAIDPIKECNNWYLQNVKTFGNSKYLFKCVIGITIIESIIFVILFHIVDAQFSPKRKIYSNLWFFGLFLIPSVISTFLFYKITTEVAKDNLGILQEIKNIGILFLVAGIGGIIGSLTTPTEYFRIEFAVLSLILTLILMYFTFPHPQKLFNKYQQAPLNQKIG